jgi:hypothetical protein
MVDPQTGGPWIMSDLELNLYMSELSNVVRVMMPIHRWLHLGQEAKTFVDNVIRTATNFWDDTYHIMDTIDEFTQLFRSVGPRIGQNFELLLMLRLAQFALRILVMLISVHDQLVDPPRVRRDPDPDPYPLGFPRGNDRQHQPAM